MHPVYSKNKDLKIFAASVDLEEEEPSDLTEEQTDDTDSEIVSMDASGRIMSQKPTSDEVICLSFLLLKMQS
jgi:hypothetical protein